MILAKTMTKPTHEPPYARTQRCCQAVAEEARAAIATANEATRRLRAIMRSSSRASSSTPCTHQRLAHLLAMASLRDDCVAVPLAKGRDYSRPALAHRATSRFSSPPHPRRSRTRHPGGRCVLSYDTAAVYSTRSTYTGTTLSSTGSRMNIFIRTGRLVKSSCTRPLATGHRRPCTRVSGASMAGNRGAAVALMRALRARRCPIYVKLATVRWSSAATQVSHSVVWYITCRYCVERPECTRSR